MKHFINNTDDDDDDDDDDNNNNNTYDGKIMGKISDIRMMLSRLGNTVTNNDRKKIKKELYETEKKASLSDKENESNYNDLVKLVETLHKKEKYKNLDHDDLDYYRLRDIKSLFDNDNDNDDDYYKPTLAEISFKNNYKYYESRGDKVKKLSVNQCLYPYLSDLINDHKTNGNNSNEWKIQVNMHVNFASSNDIGETIFLWSDNEEIRLANETDDIFKRLLNFFLNNYQTKEIVLRNGSNVVFESVDLLSYHIHKTSLKRGQSYMKSPEWVINKRATINPKNKDKKCFQYSTTVALNHQKIENHPERIPNIEPFIDQYNWESIYTLLLE